MSSSIEGDKKNGSEIIRRLLEENKVFSIVRVGLGAETVFAYRVSKMQSVEPYITIMGCILILKDNGLMRSLSPMNM